MQLRALSSWDDLEHGDRIVYIGADILPGDYAAPKARKQPYRFLHTYHTGDPALEDKYGCKRLLESDHPLTDAKNWRRATDAEVSA